MNYGYNIERIANGYIVTTIEPAIQMGMQTSGLPHQTRHVFLSLDEMLTFLRSNLDPEFTKEFQK